MAPKHRSPQSSDARPRLGCWLRLWIVFAVITTSAMLSLATSEGAWTRLGVIPVLFLSIAYAVIALVMGLTIAWIFRGRQS